MNMHAADMTSAMPRSFAGMKAEASAMMGAQPAAETPAASVGAGFKLEAATHDPFQNNAGISIPGGADRVTNPLSMPSFWNNIESPPQPGCESFAIKSAPGGLPPVQVSSAEHAARALAGQQKQVADLAKQSISQQSDGLGRFRTAPVGLG